MKELNEKQREYYNKVMEIVHELKNIPLSRWDVANIMIGYYGEINADHIAAINEGVREGAVVL